MSHSIPQIDPKGGGELKTITIQGVDYVEADPDHSRAGPFGEVCSQCAFGSGLLKCHEAIDRTPKVFGGDCNDRDVIYAPAQKDSA